MANYRKMYLRLFGDVTKAVSLLQQAQRDAEEEYIQSDGEGPRRVVLELMEQDAADD